MKPKKPLARPYLAHPFLFALYPVLFLWVDNIDQTPFYAVLPSMAYAALLGLVVLGVCALVFRELSKSAAAASFTVLFTLSYGHVYNYVESLPELNALIGYYRLLTIGLILLGACWVVLWRHPGELRSLNQALLAVSLVLVLVTVGQGLVFYARGIPSELSAAGEQLEGERQVPGSEYPPRDVYYIILDSYSREDLLRSRYGYDNRAFLGELEDLGFVVPRCTQSNYDNTVFSMTSSLNMNYLPDLPIPFDETWDSIDIQGTTPFIRNSLVRQEFEALGYQTAAFKTVYPFLEIKDADIYVDVEASAEFYDRLETDNFQYLFFNTTVLRVLIEVLETSPDYMFAEDATTLQVYLARVLTPQKELFSGRHFKWYDQHLFAFERLAELPEVPGKKFVYAHLFTTHQPFVFTTSGQVRWPVLEDDQAYLDQITYTNRRLVPILETIIARSATPPVIVLQGDHSYAHGVDRNKILNAYYLPESGGDRVTADFSPVNTFRLIFNTYFGGDYELLPNTAYTSPDGRPYQLEPLPGSCVGGAE